MGNRAQRRAEKRKGLKPGQTYADVLSQKKMIREAVEQSVHDTSVQIEADIKMQRQLWIAIVALNEAFGFGGERAMRFMEAMQEVEDECRDLAQKHGGVYAREKLMKRASQITGIAIQPIHEDAMVQARKENEAQGIFFKEDDPEKW